MTEYSNPQIPEGINVSSEHPLKEFAAMALGVGLIIGVCIVVLTLLSNYLVRFIPFSVEENLAKRALESSIFNTQSSPQNQEKHEIVEAYLRNIATSLTNSNQKHFPITVHYIDDSTVNAFATLGGHILITRALIEKMPSENALSMVIAHEIAHVQNRDPIMALGRGLTLGLAITSLLGLSDGAIGSSFIGEISLLTQLKFSRSAELKADEDALETLLRHYGHLQDADSIFYILSQESGHQEPYALFSTHPLNEERIKQITRISAGQEPRVGTQAVEEIPIHIQNIVNTTD